MAPQFDFMFSRWCARTNVHPQLHVQTLLAPELVSTFTPTALLTFSALWPCWNYHTEFGWNAFSHSDLQETELFVSALGYFLFNVNTVKHNYSMDIYIYIYTYKKRKEKECMRPMWARISLILISQTFILVKTYRGYYFPVTLLGPSGAPHLTLHLRGPKQGSSLFRGSLLFLVFLHTDWVPLSPGNGFQCLPGGMRTDQSDCGQDMSHLPQ